VDGGRGDKVAFMALLVLVWLAFAWCDLKQAQFIVGLRRDFFINRMALCLLI